MKPPKGRKDDVYWDRFNEKMLKRLHNHPQLKAIFDRFKEQLRDEGDPVRRSP